MFKQTLLALSLAAASTAALALPNIAVLATGGTRLPAPAHLRPARPTRPVRCR